jgi:hypothetical protein
VFRLTRALPRALRVLLTCLALALATPTATAAVGRDLPALVVGLASSSGVARATTLRVACAAGVYAHEPRASYGSRSCSAQPRFNGARVRARPAFLLNCSWLC